MRIPRTGLAGMNCSADKTYELMIPSAFAGAVNLSSHQAVKGLNKLTVLPMSTVVLAIK